MLIWLDDVRPAPLSNEKWTCVSSGEQLLALIDAVGLENIDEISFDNDLGAGNLEGYQILDEIERRVLTGHVARIPKLWVHSGNPVARQRMNIIIERIKTYALQQSLL